MKSKPLSAKRIQRELQIETRIHIAATEIRAALRLMTTGTNLLSERTRRDMEGIEQRVRLLREYHRANYNQ